MVKAKSKTLLEYPDGISPRLSDECARLKHNQSFKFWIERAQNFHVESEFQHALACEALAYTRHDNEAFLRFGIDVLGFRDISPGFHGQMIPHITGLLPGKPLNQPVVPYRMLLAFRGSLKSTLSSIELPAFRIAQSTVKHDWEECTARIALASEKIALAKQHVGAVRTAVDSPHFKRLFGQHKPTKRDEGSWGNEMFRSRLQKAIYAKDPTVFTMSLSVDRTGFHCTSIVADDLQARSSTFNLEQIEKAYELYRLCHSILDPESADEFIEMLLAGTPWHYDDVSARIEAESKKMEQEEASRKAIPAQFHSVGALPRFYIKKIPAWEWVSKDPPIGTPKRHTDLREIEGTHAKEVVCLTAAWPSRMPIEKLESIRGIQGNEIFNAQYLLDPIPQSDRVFLQKDTRYRDTLSDEKMRSNPHVILIGGDPAWMSQESVRLREGVSTANSVLVAAAVDPSYTLHILSVFRQKCTVPEFTEELWRLYFNQYEKVHAVSLQQYDYKHLAPEFRRKFAETKKIPNIRFVSSSGSGKEDRPDKNDRIRARLSGLWSAHKILLPRGHPEVEKEFYEFPKGKKDFLDALTNIVEIMFAPRESLVDEARKGISTNIIDSIESGVPLGENSELSWKNGY